MIKVAIDTWYHNKFSWTDHYGSRVFMQDIFKKHNIELVRVSINKFNSKQESFKEYNTFDKNGNNKIIKKKYTADIIRNRKWMWAYHKYNIFKNITTTPSKKIMIISNDKFEIYKFTSEFQPFTSLLSTFFGNETIQKKFKNKIVLKPIRANSGKWILLTNIKELLKQKNNYIWLEELYIVQQYKNFTTGYPKICSTNHDIRCMFAGKKIIESTLRIPKKWDFRSNIWSWGKQFVLGKKKIPKELLSLTKKIYKKLGIDDTNIFSMDFAYCKNDKQRYLLEINASPGTWYYQTDKKKLEKICNWLATFFISLKK